jgi:NADH:ubiquinone reductase (non-electrogenic)
LEKVSVVVSIFGGSFLVYKGLDYLQESSLKQKDAGSNKQKLVILGSGWGALSMAGNINTYMFDVTVVSPRNYFLFTPGLPDVTVGTTTSESVTEPIRNFAQRNKKALNYYEASASDIDINKKAVTCKTADGKDFTVNYDKLVIAVGSVPNTLGLKEIEKNCLFLRDLQDSKNIKKRIIDAFEKASLPSVTDDEKKKLLNFVIVGGSPVAYEMAHNLHEFIVQDLKSQFPALAETANVTLVSTKEHINNFYDRSISEYMALHNNTKGVNIVKSTNVVAVDKDSVTVKRFNRETKADETVKLPFGLCVWSTGGAPHPLINMLRTKLKGQNNTRALITDNSLAVAGAKDVWALGDCATIDQGKLINKAVEIFKKLDVNGDGRVDVEEYEALVKNLARQFPALLEVANNSRELFVQADTNKDGTLDREEFAGLLRSFDARLTRLPSTATVAAQQGTFLAKAFNRSECNYDDPTERTPFRYKHIGGFEYVGAEDGFVERGSESKAIVTGLGAYWMWRAAYWSKLVGVNMRVKMLANDLYSTVFGRESTKN